MNFEIGGTKVVDESQCDDANVHEFIPAFEPIDTTLAGYYKRRNSDL